VEQFQLAQRIRAFRKLKGYTQDELAKQLGVSIAVLGAIERGTRKADSKMLTRISETLGVSVEEIVASGQERKDGGL
jgi:transcriptional regulator with XRE-family HTH domain